MRGRPIHKTRPSQKWFKDWKKFILFITFCLFKSINKHTTYSLNNNRNKQKNTTQDIKYVKKYIKNKQKSFLNFFVLN